MSDLASIDPADWETLGPHYQALEAEALTAAGVSDWLRRWSDLERVVKEAGAAVSRAWSENTADAAAEQAYLHHAQEIAPKAYVAAQTLKTKLLAVPDYTPGPDEAQMLRRFRSEAALFREANVPLSVEVQTLSKEYDRVVVDPELGAEFGRLRSGSLDLASRPHKAPGGYCDFFPITGLPYIFMNAVGTHEDVLTLLHESGHAFHDLASSEAQPLTWNVGAPAEFAEVASMAMELLPSPFLGADEGGFYSPEDAGRARTEHLERILQFLPYMAVVDGFQHWVYAEAPEDVTPAQLDACWDALWQRFLPGVDWTGLTDERRTGWQRKLHIFQAPFYYVEYGLAQVGALQVWRNALADPAGALGAYRSALALGNTRPVPALYAAAGARLAFDGDTLRDVTALVAAHLDD